MAILAVAAGWIAGNTDRWPAAGRSSATPAGVTPATGIALTDGTDSGDSSGASAYAQHCAICHGARGEGQPNWKVPGADGALPAPPHDATGHTWHHPDDLLLQIIAEGGTFYSPKSKMPAFAGKLTPDEMAAVLETIRGWWDAEQVSYQAERTAESDLAR